MKTTENRNIFDFAVTNLIPPNSIPNSTEIVYYFKHFYTIYRPMKIPD